MAIYEVIVRQTYNTVNCLNVFHYTVPPTIGLTPTAVELLTLMGLIPDPSPYVFPAGTLAAAWRTLVSSSMRFVEAQATEMYSVSDFYVAPYTPSIAGAYGSAPTSRFDAYGFFSNRVRTDIRRGYKRFVGVDEEVVGNYGVIGGVGATNMATLAGLMSAPLTGATAIYYPSVLSFEKIVTVGERDKYRPYETEEEQYDHAAIGVTYAPYDSVRTQNTRKK